MKLTDEQVAAVKVAIENGENISAIQKMLSQKFSISMTFMDTRFLIDDLNLELKSDKNADENADAKKNDDQLDISKVEDKENANNAAKEVIVEVSPIQEPGLMASGTVTFTDGVSAKWQLDSSGRLGLVGPSPDYRPSQEDVAAFQARLYEALQGRM